MKTSEKLEKINKLISAKCVGQEQVLTLSELNKLNISLTKIIREVREIEK